MNHVTTQNDQIATLCFDNCVLVVLSTYLENLMCALFEIIILMILFSSALFSSFFGNCTEASKEAPAYYI